MTRATQDGWASAATIGLLAASVALIVGFLAIELRSRAPLLPLGIFRLRTVPAANATQLVISAVAFSQFFLVTLYLQEVLRYSAVETGVAFVAITLTIIVLSNVAQTLVTHLGVRRVLTSGLLLTASSMALLSQLPADGHYFWNVFPALVLGGAGLAMSFVPVVIAGLSGVAREEAGVASGLINTTRQIGGAVGLAAVSTIATTYAQGTTAAGLTHGFQAAFYVLTGLAILGALISGTLIRPPAAAERIEAEPAFVPLEEAA